MEKRGPEARLPETLAGEGLLLRLLEALLGDGGLFGMGSRAGRTLLAAGETQTCGAEGPGPREPLQCSKLNKPSCFVLSVALV